jgi:hypothetical protein
MSQDVFFVTTGWLLALGGTAFVLWQAMSGSQKEEKLALSSLIIGVVLICLLLGL